MKTISGIYKELLRIESMQPNSAAAIKAGVAHLMKTLESVGMSYDEFVFSLEVVHA